MSVAEVSLASAGFPAHEKQYKKTEISKKTGWVEAQVQKKKETKESEGPSENRK